jgi:hypothetical protein
MQGAERANGNRGANPLGQRGFIGCIWFSDAKNDIAKQEKD